MRLDGHSASKWLLARFSVPSEVSGRPSHLLTLALLLTATLALEAVDDVVARRRTMEEALRKATAEYAAKVPADAYTRGPDGRIIGVNPKDPRVQELDTQWRQELARIRATHDVNDTRFEDLNEACKRAGVEDELANSGSRPKSIKSDVDLSERIPGSGKKLADALSKSGYHVKELPDRYLVQETDTTIWRKPPDMEVGSPAHREWLRQQLTRGDSFATSGGKFETTGGETGYLDPEGAALANANKMADAGGMRDPAAGIDGVDGHAVGKSVSKAAEWTGTKTESEFFRQADVLRNHASWEEAGVCHPADPPEVKAAKIREFLNQAQESMVKSVEAGRVQSETLDGLRTEQVSKANAQGDHELANGVREQQAEIKVGNQETMKRLAETNPEFAAKLNGMKVTPSADGTFTDVASGETLTPSQLREKISTPTREATVQATEKAIQGGEAASKGARAVEDPIGGKGTPPEGAPTVNEGEPGGKGGGMSTGMKAAGLFVMIYGIYEGYHTGFEQAVDEERPDDYTGQTFAKALAYTVWHGLGLGGAAELGREGARESVEQFRKDLEAGKDPSETWAHMRAVMLGYRNLVKAATYDQLANGLTAVKEGLGLGVDSAKALIAERNAAQQLAAATKAKKEAFEKLTGAREKSRPAGAGRSLPYGVEELVRSFHTHDRLQEHLRKLCEAAATSDGDDPRLRSAFAAQLYDKESPAIIKAWEEKRAEYRQEYVGLAARLRSGAVGVKHTPDPAVMPADDRALELEVEVVFQDESINEATVRMEELLGLLAGAGSVRATCSFGGGPKNSFKKTLSAPKPGKYEVAATVTITCGEEAGGENASLKCVIQLPVSATIEVEPPTGMFRGRVKGKYLHGEISFSIAGTRVEGLFDCLDCYWPMIGTFDPATGAIEASVNYDRPVLNEQGEVTRTYRVTASVVGTYEPGCFRGTYTWSNTTIGDRGTWSARGTLPPKSPR